MFSQLPSDLSKKTSKTDLSKRLPEENVHPHPSGKHDTSGGTTSHHVGEKPNPTRFYRNDPSPFLEEIRNIDENLRRSAIGHYKLEFPSRKTKVIKIQLDVGNMIHEVQPDSEMEKTSPRKKHILPPLNERQDLQEAVELLKTFSCLAPEEETVLLTATSEQQPIDHSEKISERQVSERQNLERQNSQTIKQSVSEMNHPFQLPEIVVQLKRKFPGEFAQLTDCLKNILDLKRQSMIAVCGLEPQTGCSTILLSIAYGLQLQGKKISIIDADFKCPTLKDDLKTIPPWGWTELLQNDFSADHVAFTAENIRFFPLLNDMDSALRNWESHELRQAIRQTFQTHCEDSDLIFLDCGPLLPPQGEINMAILELFQPDGVLFVMRSGRQPKFVDLLAFDRALQDHDFANYGVVENFFDPEYKKAA